MRNSQTYFKFNIYRQNKLVVLGNMFQRNNRESLPSYGGDGGGSGGLLFGGGSNGKLDGSGR